MKVWFTSDLHFGHKAVIKYGRRPFADVDSMDEYIIHRWNSVVDEKDHVYLLGDVSFRKKTETIRILRRLHGTIFLIKGNHDKLKGDVLKRFAWVKDYHMLKLAEYGLDHMIVLCHYPLRSWDRMHYGIWHAHGHSHGNIPPYGKSIDVGIDSAAKLIGAYVPFELSFIKSHLDKREFYSEDHHTMK